ncbi:MAG: LamG domain-containing protein, partial [Candidatus Bipolaricaulis sp.]|nr:LamG domain-containing protein [Candidatus Bipolaricaulis sp.]
MFRHKELVGATGPARAVLRAAQRWGVLSVVLVLAVGGSVSAQNCVTAPPGMVAWWPLDEVLGTVVHDIVGGLDGTAMPGTIGALAGTGPVTSAAWGPPTFPVGVVGNSLFFFLDRRVEVQSSVALNPGTGDFAIDAWVIFAASSNGQGLTIVRKGTTSGQTYRFVIDDVSSPQLSFKLEGSNGVSSLGAPILPGMWHHVAVTLERAGGGQTVTLYIDGAAANAASGADVGMIVNTEPLLIGGDGVLAGEIALDEVEIFDRALDPQEVQEIFSAGSAGKCRCVTAPCCMAAWWSLDELWGPTAHDPLGPPLSDGTDFGAPTPNPAVVQ